MIKHFSYELQSIQFNKYSHLKDIMIYIVIDQYENKLYCGMKNPALPSPTWKCP